REPMLQSADAQ
nr:Chain C, Nonstructural protein 10/11 [Severe acute respiratory syndrome coronavirus 2]7TA7_D Chain D, Nonstructural protein 10/11 [Severe acute respiratory syndrome coronavirus 2]